jgi:hypothetical protein
MGIRYVIDVARGCVITIMSGTVTGADIQGYLGALRAHPDFDARYPRIVDLRRITQMPTSAELRRVAETAPALEPGSARRALIADRDYPYGLLRMFEIITGIHSTSTEYRAFRDPASAAEWLGLDPSVTAPLDLPDNDDPAA